MTRILTREQVGGMCGQYAEGKSTWELAGIYGVSQPAVWTMLKRHGIAMRPPSMGNLKYSCNHGFWNEVSTEAQAYWLGFIAADGSVQGNGLTVILKRQDRDHLVRLAAALSSSHPVRDRAVTVHGIVNGTYETATWGVRSKELTDDLAMWGMRAPKSFSLRWPDAIHLWLLRHYLRGVFDGDGHVDATATARRRGRPMTELKWSLTCNVWFAEGAQAFLMRECSLSKTKLEITNPPETRIVNLRYGGNKQVERIYRLLYDGATVWLPRKRAVFERVLGDPTSGTTPT